ncbi:MerR family DNA-binding transcriptional regulator [Oceanicoccus sp. KOV_DT_Chl]|uniref:MerR family transcriptional regulator n=1 Tax=Oceanicoccus sp. KOV_DT_Chl TaxID=1904639 RepID=UPI000C7A3BC2|nr:MerR family DNA-binding transcriptional regulator [Oceanicoccus sp. KOV_DT_Chl]
MSNTYNISDLAAEFDITTRTIRFYEEKGLLKPERNGNNRIYSPADRVALKLILRGKRLGFTLEESRDIITMYHPGQNNADQLHSLISKIREKRGQLEQQLHDLEVMMLDLESSEEKCLLALAELAPTS